MAPPRRISIAQAKVLKLPAAKAIVGETRVITSVGVGNKVGVRVVEIDGVSDNIGVGFAPSVVEGIKVGVIASIRPQVGYFVN